MSAKWAAHEITAPEISHGATEDRSVIKSKPIFDGENPVPPIVPITISVENRNAIGGFTALVNEVPGRPR